MTNICLIFRHIYPKPCLYLHESDPDENELLFVENKSYQACISVSSIASGRLR